MISNFYNISLDFYNYIFLFFNYELLVVICFFFFLTFALISEQGQIGTSLYDISIEQRLKITQYLELREKMTQDLLTFLEKSLFEIKKISISYDNACNDLILNLQYITKKLILNLTHNRVSNFLSTITLRTQYLSFQIKSYLTQDLFAKKAFILSNTKTSKLKKRFIIVS